MPPSRFHDTEHVRRAVVRHAFTDAEDWASGINELTKLSDADIERVADLLLAIDSPTGARWGRRDAKGRIVEAHGFDLSPSAQCQAEFQVLAAALKTGRARHAALRRRLTIARKPLPRLWKKQGTSPPRRTSLPAPI